MKIVVIGTRGIPDIQGGVETHCRELYPRIASMGHDVTVIRRIPYVDRKHPMTEYEGVHLVDMYAPRSKSLEAIVHTLLGVFKARRLNADVVHVHAIGPALVVPLIRLFGMKAVMTHHGPDYDRQKWGRFAKAMLKLGQSVGARFSNKVIVISNVIAGIVADKCGRRDTELIYNGVTMPEPTAATDAIEGLGLAGGDYILAMGRFVKEKGFHDLVEAYKRLPASLRERYRLVVAGDSDHPDAYYKELKKTGAETAGVIMPGYVSGELRHQLLSHAALFAMPSYHEGLPIALLEALSYGLDVAVSDIPANVIAPLDRGGDYFHTGDVESLTEILTSKLRAAADGNHTRRKYDLTPYDWDSIAAATVAVYESI